MPGTSDVSALPRSCRNAPRRATSTSAPTSAASAAGEQRGLDEVLEHVLPVATCAAGAGPASDERRVQARDARALGGVVTGRLGALVGARQRLGVRLLDALRVDPPVRHERLERHLRDLAALGVEAGQHHRVGLVVHEHVHAGQRLEGPDVAALLADDPALHLVRRAAAGP